MEFKNTNYYGGKSGSGTYQKIINQIPAHKIYVELFGGMLGIFRHKRKAWSNYVIETDERLIRYYVEKLGFVHVQRFDELLRLLEMGGTRNYCFHGSTLELFEDWRFMSLLDKEHVFIYADPPYPMSARKSDRPQYKYEFSDDDHSQLLSSLTCFCHAKVAISTYPNELYDEMIWGYGTGDRWRRIEFESQTRNGTATEQLWMNYEETTQLHDFQYIGEDYRERERITRMQRRWRRKFKDLPVIEQRAMLQNLKTMLDATDMPTGR